MAKYSYKYAIGRVIHQGIHSEKRFMNRGPNYLSARNHFQIGIGADKLDLCFGSLSRPTMDMRTEMGVAAIQVWAQAQSLKYAELVLYHDGSYAAQVQLMAFRASNIPVRCLVPKLGNERNIIALSAAIVQCQETNTAFEFFHLDWDSFIQSERATKIALQIQSADFSQILAHEAWSHCKNKNQFIVFPFGLMLPKKDDKGWRFLASNHGLGLFSAFKQEAESASISGIPHFFMWSPELIFSIFSAPYMLSTITNMTECQRFGALAQRELFRHCFTLSSSFDFNGFESASLEQKKFARDCEKLGLISKSYACLFVDLFRSIEGPLVTSKPAKKVS